MPARRTLPNQRTSRSRTNPWRSHFSHAQRTVHRRNQCRRSHRHVQTASTLHRSPHRHRKQGLRNQHLLTRSVNQQTSALRHHRRKTKGSGSQQTSTRHHRKSSRPRHHQPSASGSGHLKASRGAHNKVSDNWPSGGAGKVGANRGVKGGFALRPWVGDPIGGGGEGGKQHLDKINLARGLSDGLEHPISLENNLKSRNLQLAKINNKISRCKSTLHHHQNTTTRSRKKNQCSHRKGNTRRSQNRSTSRNQSTRTTFHRCSRI